MLSVALKFTITAVSGITLSKYELHQIESMGPWPNSGCHPCCSHHWSSKFHLLPTSRSNKKGQLHGWFQKAGVTFSLSHGWSSYLVWPNGIIFHQPEFSWNCSGSHFPDPKAEIPKLTKPKRSCFPLKQAIYHWFGICWHHQFSEV